MSEPEVNTTAGLTTGQELALVGAKLLTFLRDVCVTYGIGEDSEVILEHPDGSETSEKVSELVTRFVQLVKQVP